MRLFNLIKKYFIFGLGVAFGASIATVVTYVTLSVCYGQPDTYKVLDISECLQEKLYERQNNYGERGV